MRRNNKNTIHEYQHGFALIELLMVIGIIALITVFVYNSLNGFRQQSDIDSAGEGALSALHLARSKTLSSENSSNYGVHFESATYTLFTGRIYSGGDPLNIAYPLPNTVEISEINLSTSTQSVVFERLTGRVSATGTIVMRPTGDPSKARILQIDPSGESTLDATSITALNTRITDTRHLHFDLGWSIQNAETLRLRFSDPPNPDVINDIGMLPVAPRNTYAWAGDTNVYGQNQFIRVDAHTLDSSNTVLSIRRHRDENNRALTVSIIDGIEKEIVSYTASGTAAVGIFGGTMSAQ